MKTIFTKKTIKRKINDNRYILNYQELKENYLQFVAMSDDEFIKNFNRALHLTCIISFLKETPSYILLGDEGLIHEMGHFLSDALPPTVNIKDIRKLFNFWCKLD